MYVVILIDDFFRYNNLSILTLFFYLRLLSYFEHVICENVCRILECIYQTAYAYNNEKLCWKL